MSSTGKIFLGVAFSIGASLAALQLASWALDDPIPLVWWVFCAICPALVSAPVCVVLVRQSQRNQMLSFQLRLALEELQHFSRIDQTTGLLNRSAILSPVHPAATDHQVAQNWIMRLDVDQFKDINATYGYHTGDLVLKEVARVIRASTRSTDLCGRLGGEEFAMILYDCAAETAVRRAERLRREIARIIVAGPDGAEISPTVSVGISAYDQSQAVSRALHSADAAIQRARQGGCNRVVMAG